MQKLSFLPEAQNDMIFSIICEELGLFGAVAIILMFIMLLWRMMVIANNAPDLFGAMLVVGVMELTVTNKADLYTRATFHLQRCSRCERPFAPQKTVALAAELLAQQQNAPQNREMLRAQASVCPECKQRATLINDDTDVPLVAKEQL